MTTVIYEKQDRIATITLNRPEALNAYNLEMVRELNQIWADLKADDGVWVGILTGAGTRAFCTGHDMKEIEQWSASREAEIPTFWYGEVEIYKPIIAAVNGHCLGGGCSMALACDIRVAAEHATFGYPQPKYGLMSMGGHQRLPRMLPPGIAMELILTGRTLSAQEAHRWGIVNQVVPQDELMAAARRLAEDIRANAPLAVQASKEAFLRGQRMPLLEGIRLAKELFGRILLTEDGQEGLRAFREKRTPVWRGR